MTGGTDGLVDIDEVGMRWELGQEGWLAEEASCDQWMVRKERGMFDRKELRLSGGTVGLGGEEDARELAATEDLGEKGIFGDASAEQLVGRRDRDRLVSATLNVVERGQHTRCFPGATELTGLALVVGRATAVVLGRGGAASVAIAVAATGDTDAARAGARSRSGGRGATLTAIAATRSSRVVVICLIVTEIGQLEKI